MLTSLVYKFRTLQVDKGSIINIPEENWIRVPLNSNQNLSIVLKLVYKIYPVGTKDRQAIDVEFDKLYN